VVGQPADGERIVVDLDVRAALAPNVRHYSASPGSTESPDFGKCGVIM
jgi:hypothetical protein